MRKNICGVPGLSQIESIWLVRWRRDMCVMCKGQGHFKFQGHMNRSYREVKVTPKVKVKVTQAKLTINVKVKYYVKVTTP